MSKNQYNAPAMEVVQFGKEDSFVPSLVGPRMEPSPVLATEEDKAPPIHGWRFLAVPT